MTGYVFIASIVHSKDKIELVLIDEENSIIFRQDHNNMMHADIDNLVKKLLDFCKNHDNRRVAMQNIKIINFSRNEIRKSNGSWMLEKPFSEDAMFSIWKLLYSTV